MRIAWLTPLSLRSAIGQYSSIILVELSKHAEITIYASDVESRSDSWLPKADMRFMSAIPRTELVDELRSYDMVVYNLGDNLGYHLPIFESAIEVPGVVILHDLVMHHFFAGYYLEHLKNPVGYLHELEYAHGEEGRHFGQSILDGVAGNVWLAPAMLEFNMARSAVHRCVGVVAHSEFAKNEVERLTSAPTWHIDFPTPRIVERVPVHRSHASSQNKVEFLTFGVINTNKVVDGVITAFARSALLRERAIYNIIGEAGVRSYSEELQQLIRRHGLQNVVHVLGYQSDEVLQDHLTRADVVVNLRNPHFGESSWVLVESMIVGKPVVVWKHGFYDEVPDDTVAKVSDLMTLRHELESLCLDSERRADIGRRARQFAVAQFDTKLYCQRLLAAIESLRVGQPIVHLVDIVSEILTELGVLPEDVSLIDQISDEIAVLSGDLHSGTRR